MAYGNLGISFSIILSIVITYSACSAKRGSKGRSSFLRSEEFSAILSTQEPGIYHAGTTASANVACIVCRPYIHTYIRNHTQEIRRVEAFGSTRLAEIWRAFAFLQRPHGRHTYIHTYFWVFLCGLELLCVLLGCHRAIFSQLDKISL